MTLNKSSMEIEAPSLKSIVENQKEITRLITNIDYNTQLNTKILREIKNVVDRIARRSKPQRKEGLWNWVKDTAKGIFHIGVETYTIASIVSGIAEINSALIAQNGFISSELATQTGLINENTGAEAGSVIKFVDGKDAEASLDRKETADKMENYIGEQWKDGKKEIAENLDATKKDLTHLIPDIVANRVVGQSYNVWDGTCKYAPTLKFAFTERTRRMLKRKTEISVRLNVKPDSINPRYCKQLGERIIEQQPWIYTRGQNRYFYVDYNKRWKTTMYVTEMRAAEQIIDRVCNVLQIRFDPDQGSYTTKKPRRRIGLMNPMQTKIPENTMNMDVPFDVELYRGVILLNGATSPITIYAKRETGEELLTQYEEEKLNGYTKNT